MNFRSPAARDQGLDETTIRSIGSERPERLTPAESAAARFAELLAIDHQSIDDAVLEELRRHFTEEQILEIGWAAGSFVAFGRLIHVFGGTWEADPTSIRPSSGR